MQRRERGNALGVSKAVGHPQLDGPFAAVRPALELTAPTLNGGFPLAREVDEREIRGGADAHNSQEHREPDVGGDLETLELHQGSSPAVPVARTALSGASRNAICLYSSMRALASGRKQAS